MSSYKGRFSTHLEKMLRTNANADAAEWTQLALAMPSTATHETASLSLPVLLPIIHDTVVYFACLTCSENIGDTVTDRCQPNFKRRRSQSSIVCWFHPTPPWHPSVSSDFYSMLMNFHSTPWRQLSATLEGSDVADCMTTNWQQSTLHSGRRHMR